MTTARQAMRPGRPELDDLLQIKSALLAARIEALEISRQVCLGESARSLRLASGVMLERVLDDGYVDRIETRECLVAIVSLSEKRPGAGHDDPLLGLSRSD